MRSLFFARTPALAGILALLVSGTVAAGFELPQGPNRNLVYGQCRTCHDLQYVVDSAGLPRDEWAAILANMRQFGLRIPDEQREKILDYLAVYLGPNPPAAGQPAAPVSTASANGETLFKSMCTGCHQADGRGVAGVFPPLAGKGKIKVGGTIYQSEMPPFGHLSDSDIAALVNYVRNAWGNDKLNTKALAPVEAAKVAAAREKSMAAEAVRSYRDSLL